MFFTEWLQNRLSEAAHDRLYARDYQASADISPESFERDQANPDNRVNYVVITNAIGMLRDLIKGARKGGTVVPENYTAFKIESIDGDQVTMTRNTNQTYSQGQTKTIPLDAITDFEVTDAFKDLGMGKNNTRYFLSAARSGVAPRLRELMQKWLELTQHSALGNSKEDRQDAAIGHFLGGDQALKSKINQGANDAKTEMWKAFDDRASRGEDITKFAMDAAHDDTSGVNRMDSDGFQRFIMAVAPNVYTQLRLNGHIGEVSPDERRLLANLEQVDAVVKSGMADQVLSNNPEVDWITQNPNAVQYAFVMGFPHAANWLRENPNSDVGFFAKIGQQQQQEPVMRPSDFRGPQSVQTQDQARNPMSQPSPLEKLLQGESRLRESMHWRRYNDKKNYKYY